MANNTAELVNETVETAEEIVAPVVEEVVKNGFLQRLKDYAYSSARVAHYTIGGVLIVGGIAGAAYGGYKLVKKVYHKAVDAWNDSKAIKAKVVNGTDCTVEMDEES